MIFVNIAFFFYMRISWLSVFGERTVSSPFPD